MDLVLWRRLDLLLNNNRVLTVPLKECSNVQVLLSRPHLLIKVDLQLHPVALEDPHEQLLEVLLLPQFAHPLLLLNIVSCKLLKNKTLTLANSFPNIFLSCR